MVFKPLPLVLTLLVVSSQLKSSAPCGVPRPPGKFLVVNGWDTTPGAWPWHAALYHRKHFADKYLCGGTLISEWFVLTAAHCTVNPNNNYQRPTAEFFIRLGVHNLNRMNRLSLQEHAIDKIFQADRFNPQEQRHDIALLRLSTKADFDQYVQPACLNQESDLSGQRGTAIGWGLTEEDSLSATLKGVQMPVIEDLKCLESDRDTFGNALAEGIFCAGYRNGTAVCNGDSGGGLFFQRRGAWYLGGIVSFSTAREGNDTLCNSKGYGAFTKVSHYIPWIGEVAGAELIAENAASSDEQFEVPRVASEETASQPQQPNFRERPQTSGSYGTNNRPVSTFPDRIGDTDENNGVVKHEWSTHSVDEDPLTGGVVRKETHYRTVNYQSQSSNGIGPAMSPFQQNNHHFSDHSDLSDLHRLHLEAAQSGRTVTFVNGQPVQHPAGRQWRTVSSQNVSPMFGVRTVHTQQPTGQWTHFSSRNVDYWK